MITLSRLHPNQSPVGACHHLRDATWCVPARSLPTKDRPTVPISNSNPQSTFPLRVAIAIRGGTAEPHVPSGRVLAAPAPPQMSSRRSRHAFTRSLFQARRTPPPSYSRPSPCAHCCVACPMAGEPGAATRPMADGHVACPRAASRTPPMPAVTGPCTTQRRTCACPHSAQHHHTSLPVGSQHCGSAVTTSSRRIPALPSSAHHPRKPEGARGVSAPVVRPAQRRPPRTHSLPVVLPVACLPWCQSVSCPRPHVPSRHPAPRAPFRASRARIRYSSRT